MDKQAYEHAVGMVLNKKAGVGRLFATGAKSLSKLFKSRYKTVNPRMASVIGPNINMPPKVRPAVLTPPNPVPLRKADIGWDGNWNEQTVRLAIPGKGRTATGTTRPRPNSVRPLTYEYRDELGNIRSGKMSELPDDAYRHHARIGSFDKAWKDDGTLARPVVW